MIAPPRLRDGLTREQVLAILRDECSETITHARALTDPRMAAGAVLAARLVYHAVAARGAPPATEVPGV